MKRVSSLLLLLALSVSQIAATWCPMASEGLGAGGDMREMASMPADAHARHGGGETSSAGHETEGHEGHDGHGDEASCLILMSCGTMATSVPAMSVSVLSLLEMSADGSGPRDASSLSVSMEPPPPRLV